MSQSKYILLEGEEFTKNFMKIEEYSATIVLVGRTRSGKSTIAEVLEDPRLVPPSINLYSKTKKLEKIQRGKFLIIDMPGFFDCNAYGSHENRLSNDGINKLLHDFISTGTDVNLFGLVFSLSEGINADDIESMMLVMKKYERFSKKFALVITHCEQMNDKERKALINDFFLNADVCKYGIKPFFEKGVLFMGSCRPQSLARKDNTALLLQYGNVLDMREKFIRECLRENGQNITQANSTPRYVCCLLDMRNCNRSISFNVKLDSVLRSIFFLCCFENIKCGMCTTMKSLSMRFYEIHENKIHN